MNSDLRVEKQKEIIEEIGKFFDKKGMQPIAGRVIGLLIAMDKEQFTFDEIVEELQISKSSASNVIRNLEIRGDIDYITIPGDRKKYYRIKLKNPSGIFDDFKREMERMSYFFKRVLDLKADKESDNSIYFRDLINIITLFLNELESLKEKFNKA